MIEPSGKILGLDYGDARIGVAICSASTKMAFPRDVILNKSRPFVFEHIAKIVREDGITAIVVGVPYSLDDHGETSQTKKVRRFMEDLKVAIDLPVYEQDETLTTFEAESSLSSMGIQAKSQKMFTDSISAALIVETFLGK